MQPKQKQQGAALLTAMVIVTLIATLASAMVWRQYRAVQIEAADRARATAGWVLVGALDWARLILREDDNRGQKVDHLGEVWAVPLAESRLSTFLAADRSSASSDEDSGPEAFLSGTIDDAQSRFNLRRFALRPDMDAADLRTLERLCDMAGLSKDQAKRWAQSLREALLATGDTDNAPLPPRSLEQMAWMGMDASARRKLETWVVLLPDMTPVNLNTAPREVLTALFDGMDLATASRLERERKLRPFNTLDDVKAQLQGHPALPAITPERASVNSSFFIVTGRLRLEERVMEQRSLVQRDAQQRVKVLRRERVNSLSEAETRKREPLPAP